MKLSFFVLPNSLSLSSNFRTRTVAAPSTAFRPLLASIGRLHPRSDLNNFFESRSGGILRSVISGNDAELSVKRNPSHDLISGRVQSYLRSSSSFCRLLLDSSAFVPDFPEICIICARNERSRGHRERGEDR